MRTSMVDYRRCPPPPQGIVLPPKMNSMMVIGDGAGGCGREPFRFLLACLHACVVLFYSIGRCVACLFVCFCSFVLFVCLFVSSFVSCFVDCSIGLFDCLFV